MDQKHSSLNKLQLITKKTKVGILKRTVSGSKYLYRSLNVHNFFRRGNDAFFLNSSKTKILNQSIFFNFET